MLVKIDVLFPVEVCGDNNMLLIPVVRDFSLLQFNLDIVNELVNLALECLQRLGNYSPFVLAPRVQFPDVLV